MATTTAVALRDPTITAIEAYPMALEEVHCITVKHFLSNQQRNIALQGDTSGGEPGLG